MKLSIIIPVYNAEKYLHKCLESIVLQELKLSFEVIIINDGSTDNSLKISESYQDKIANYHIFTNENQGEAFSRNIALKRAQGEYITFLDSDDYYDVDCLKTAVAIIDQNNLDILYLRLRQVDEQGNFIRFGFDLPQEGSILKGLEHSRRPFPATVYKQETIGGILFPLEILVGSDSVFNALVQSKSKKVSFTNKAMYNYTHRANSLSTKGFSSEAFQGFINAIKIISNFKKENFEPEDATAKKYFENIIIVFIRRIIDWNILPVAEKNRYLLMCKTLDEQEYTYLLKVLSKDYKFIDQSFTKFMLYQKQLRIKSKIHQLIVPKKK